MQARRVHARYMLGMKVKDTDDIYTRELRGFAVDEVKRTNGQVSFENAVHQQRRIEPEDEWPGLY